MIYDTNFLVAIQGRKKGFTRTDTIAWMKRKDCLVDIVAFLGLATSGAWLAPSH